MKMNICHKKMKTEDNFLTAENLNNFSNISNKPNNINPSLNDYLSYNDEQFDSKYSVKINKIKDDYIDFL